MTTEHRGLPHLGPTRVCRELASTIERCSQIRELRGSDLTAAQGNAPLTASYTDTIGEESLLHPNGKATYAVEVMNRYSRSAGLSNQVTVPLLPALPPPEHFQATISADGVRLLWTCPAALLNIVPNARHDVRVFRRVEGTPNETVAGAADLTICQQPQIVDHRFDWEKTYLYRAAVISIAPDGGRSVEAEGNSTPVVTVFAHDTFPPAAPSGLQAVFSGADRGSFVDLVWTPNSEADLAGYNVYRHESGTGREKVNSEIVKAPAFRDAGVHAGMRYFYTITAVDERGNESAASSEASEAVP